MVGNRIPLWVHRPVISGSNQRYQALHQKLRAHHNPSFAPKMMPKMMSRYHARSNVETTFPMIKAKFGDSLRSKSDVGQFNEVLCKVIAHNLCVLISCIHEIGLEVPTFVSAS